MSAEYKTTEAQRRAVAKYDKEHVEEARLRKREWARKNKEVTKRHNQNHYMKMKERKALFKALPIGVC